MSNFQIPLINIPQTFDIVLGGVQYILTCRYNSAPEGGWMLDFVDAVSNTRLASNIPLVTGVNILEGLEYLNFKGKIFVLTDGDQFAVPTLENLGVESFVYFQTEDAVA